MIISRICSLNNSKVTPFTRMVEEVASSYETNWEIMKTGSDAAMALPDLLTLDVRQMCWYRNTSGKLKSTVTHGKRYLQGTNRRLGNFFHSTKLDGGTFLYSLDATASFGTVPRTGKRDYSIFITVLGNVMYAYCCCKNGRSARCSHIAASLLVLMQVKNNTTQKKKNMVEKLCDMYPSLNM